MSTASAQQERCRNHAAKWELLRARYLPIDTSDSIWRYNRFPDSDDPEQGWKLHISATILSANKTFARVAPYLRETNVMFKAPCSLEELEKLNNGSFYGYSQVGKFITIYPRNDSEAVSLATELDRLTTGLPPGPLIPFDSRFGSGSVVYYRYGSFSLQMADGRTDAIRTPEGDLIEDSRTAGESKPKWVVDLFPRQPLPSNQDLSGKPLRVIGALSQRGKGGVYDAIDFSVAPPRRCVIKQGRFGGELSWDGRDGAWRVKNETRISERLARAGIEVPLTYAKFKIQKNYYVVMEHIEGETLQAFLEKQQRRLRIRQVLDFAKQIASLLARIHHAGWLWLDCKPANLMLTPNGKLRPLDFEGACPLRQPVSLDWQTPAFVPPRSCGNDDGPLAPAKDVYALGVTCYFLLTGRLPDVSEKVRLSTLRRSVPKQLQNVVELLLNPNPRVRPQAEEVSTLLAGC